MKKVVSCLLAAACIATMSAGVMAEKPDFVADSSNKYNNVEITGLNNETRYGFLVLNANALTDPISEDSIMYIDQKTAANGKITFDPFIPKETITKDTDTKYYVFLGGEGYTDGYDESGNLKYIATLSAAQSVLTVEPSTLNLTVNATATLTAKIDGAVVTNPDGETIPSILEWSSSNKDAVSVNKVTGEVTAIAATQEPVAITVTHLSSGKTATCTVTVTDGIPGDMDGSGKFTPADAIYLMNSYYERNVPDEDKEYPIDSSINCDVDSSGKFTPADAIYLMNSYYERNVPDEDKEYPLYPSK